jgi:filamentous hemagglutinin family protein
MMNKIKLLLTITFLSNFIFINSISVNAQITPDSTLGNESSQINSNVLIKGSNADQINGGATRGNNLFHSFSEFNIKDGQRVYFANPSGVFNILTRVTGKDASSIFGTLGVDGNANLFLMNPNGILFGKNASLDVQGSFVGTTANALQFGNQGVFSATNPQAPALLTINPNALVFSQQQSGAVISNQSQAAAGVDSSGVSRLGLRVPDGESLLLVGGNVSMDGGRLNALGGRVELGGLVEPGNINLLSDGSNFTLGFTDNVTRADVSLTNQAGIFVTGVGGGNLVVNARNLDILGGSVLSAGIGQGLGTPETVAGDITLNAIGEIKVVDFGSVIFNLVRRGSKGNGGNITIDTGSFKLQDGAQLASVTFGQGNSGNVTVRAKDAVTLIGQRTSIFSNVEAGGMGKGGNININSATLTLYDSAQIGTATRPASATQPAGVGDAGNVNVKISGEVDIAGIKDIFRSGIVSSVGTVGNGGNITIDAGSFKLRDGAQLTTSTSGQGNAGSVRVSAKDGIFLLSGVSILSSVQAGGMGKGGNIDINGATLTLRDGAQIATATRSALANQPAGVGDAGNVNVKVTGEVDIASTKDVFRSGIITFVETGTVGNGGNITIDAGSLKMRDDAVLSASTFGQGNAGNITVSAKDEVSLTGVDIFSSVEAGGVGKGGNININATTLSLQDGAVLTASTSGRGNAGNVTVSVKDAVFLSDSYIFGTVAAGGVGKGGNININAATLSLQNGAQILTLTRSASNTQPAGRGDAGNVNLKVTGVVDLAGVKNGESTAIFSSVKTGTEGNGGNITIDAGSFKLRDGALLDARTENSNRGGNITVNAKVFETLNGGQIITTTSNNGSAGKITVNATDKMIVNGSYPNYNDRVLSFPNDIDNISANSGFFVSSTGSGITGDIEINSPKITLDNQGQLNAESASGNGGNINVNSNVLLLRRGSQISTTAGTAQSGGDGGNINLNTKFIVAVPKENSDILANAFTGKGGNVNIQTQGIFGIEPRPKPTDKSDITASSELGVQGQVSIQKPDVDPSRGLIELPGGFKDESAQIDQLCGRGKIPLGRFVVVGKNGSIQSNPVVNTMQGEVDFTPLATLDESNSTNQVSPIPDSLMVQNPTPNKIVEAQAIVRGADGTLYLVAEAPKAIPYSRPAVSACAGVGK